MKNKKIYLIMLLSLMISLETLSDYSLRLSYGFMMNDKINGNSLTDGSYDLTAEFLIDPIESISVGFGLQYVWPEEYKSAPETIGSNPINSSVPIYGVAIFNMMPDSTIEPYAVGRFGYGFATVNPNSNVKEITGDLYYSIGIGGIFNNFYVETTYDVNTGTLFPNVGRAQDYEFKRFTVRFGYGFKFITTSRRSLYDEQVEVVRDTRFRQVDNLEEYDDEGNIVNKQGSYRELRDFKIIE